MRLFILLTVQFWVARQDLAQPSHLSQSCVARASCQDLLFLAPTAHLASISHFQGRHRHRNSPGRTQRLLTLIYCFLPSCFFRFGSHSVFSAFPQKASKPDTCSFLSLSLFTIRWRVKSLHGRQPLETHLKN